MIQANELRIGNFISMDFAGPTDCTVVAIDQDQIFYIPRLKVEEKTDLLRSLMVYVNPIPLTEEWLFKVGFVFDLKDDEYKDGVHNEVFSGSICVQKRHGNSNHKWELSIGCIDIRFFNYLHELQNLYFALTGKELKIEKP